MSNVIIYAIFKTGVVVASQILKIPKEQICAIKCQICMKLILQYVAKPRIQVSLYQLADNIDSADVYEYLSSTKKFLKCFFLLRVEFLNAPS